VTDANRRINVASEFVRADESMRAASLLVEAGLLHDAESRLYCAIYHAAIAVLLTEGVEPRSHAGTVSLLGLHSDYGRDFPLTPDALREDLESCEGFLDRARGGVAKALG